MPIFICFLVSACSAEGDVQEQIPGSSVPTVSTVAVETRDITSVVVTDGVVVASPQFAVLAPAQGKVSFDRSVRSLAQVSKGQRLGLVAGQAISSPASGTLVDILIPNSTSVASKLPLFTMAYSGFGVLVSVPIEEQYRLYDGALAAKVNITSGPAGLDCVLVPVHGNSDTVGASGDINAPSVLCLLPLESPVVEGLSARVGLQTGHKEGVLALPLQAVSGRAGQGVVTLVGSDGSMSDVEVSLGMSDGAYIEITGGLAVGDVVLASAPGFR